MVRLGVVSLLRETPLAYLVLYKKKEVWSPKSQSRIEDNVLYCRRWLVKRKGLKVHTSSRYATFLEYSNSSDIDEDYERHQESLYDARYVRHKGRNVRVMSCGCPADPMGGCTGDCQEYPQGGYM